MRDRFEIGRYFESSSLSSVGFLSSGEITDSLRVGREGFVGRICGKRRFKAWSERVSE